MARMSDHATIVRIFGGRVREGQEDQLREAVRGAVDWLAARDGCFGAQVCRLREDPSVLAVVSRWRDQASLDAAIQSDEYRARTVPALQYVDGEPTTQHYTSV